MKTLGYYNGKFGPLEEMTVPMNDRACYFGDGVYEATLARNGKIFALKEHLDRFSGFPPMLLLLFSEAPNPGTHLRSGNPLIRFAGFQKDLLVPEASDLHSQ